MKIKDIRKATTEEYDFINSKCPKSFLLSGNLCKKHGSIDKDIDEAIDKHDELYVPDELVHSSSFTVEDVNHFISKSFENTSL